MEKIKLLAIQMESAIGDVTLNIETVKNLLKANLDKYGNIDFVFLPELWTVGWDCPSFPASAEVLEESKAVKMLKEIAKTYNVNVIGGSFVEKKADKLFNTCPVINRNGELVCTYNKNHLYSYNGDTENQYITVGSNPVMVELDDVKIGLTICYDIRFPEIYRAYRKAGADLLVNCAAWGLKKPIPWECMTRSRATENQTFMIALTQSGQIQGDEWNIGHSRIIDYKGETITEIKDQKEGAMTATLNFAPMYDFREKCTCMNDIRESYEVKSV